MFMITICAYLFFLIFAALENISEQYECEDHLEVVIYFHRILNVFSSAERSFRTTMVEVGWINLLLKEMVIFLKRYNMKMVCI